MGKIPRQARQACRGSFFANVAAGIRLEKLHIHKLHRKVTHRKVTDHTDRKVTQLQLPRIYVILQSM
jgi:hypothetical protein